MRPWSIPKQNKDFSKGNHPFLYGTTFVAVAAVSCLCWPNIQSQLLKPAFYFLSYPFQLLFKSALFFFLLSNEVSIRL